MNKIETKLVADALCEYIKEQEIKIQNDELFKNGIDYLKVLKIENNCVFLCVKNNFYKNVVLDCFLNDIKNFINKKLNEFYLFDLVIEAESGNKNIQQSIKTGLLVDVRKDITFDKIYVSNFNKNVVLASKNIISDRYINPLFICGSVGVGKTYILHCIGNFFHSSFYDKSVKYISGDDFSRDIYQCLVSDDKNDIEILKNEYEKFDLLLIDDIQMLCKRDKINEIMFGIFNNNINNGKKVVWVSDKDPDDLKGFSQRMLSRFKSGLFLTINKPNKIELSDILKLKLKPLLSEFNFSDDAINFIVNRNNSDIRRLDGDINQLHFLLSIFDVKNNFITLDVIKQVFATSVDDNIKHIGYDVDPNVIIDMVCDIYNVKSSLVKSKTRLSNISNVRNVCMYVLRKKYNMNYTQIGSYFNGRNHSTVIDSIRKIENLISSDHSLNNFITNIIKKI